MPMKSHHTILFSTQIFGDGRSLFLEDRGTGVQPYSNDAQRNVAHSVTYGSTAFASCLYHQRGCTCPTAGPGLLDDQSECCFHCGCGYTVCFQNCRGGSQLPIGILQFLVAGANSLVGW